MQCMRRFHRTIPSHKKRKRINQCQLKMIFALGWKSTYQSKILKFNVTSALTVTLVCQNIHTICIFPCKYHTMHLTFFAELSLGIIFLAKLSIFTCFESGWLIQYHTVTQQTLAAHGLEELFFQLCCCVSFWFWREIGFGLTYLFTQSTIQLWCCVGILVLAGNSFWCYILTQCTIQLCDCVSFWLWRENVLKMRTRFYKKILSGYFIMIHQPMCVFHKT